MKSRRVPIRREAAAATLPEYTRFAVQAARRLVRLQAKRRKLRRELRAVDDELRTVKGQLRGVLKASEQRDELDTPLPAAALLVVPHVDGVREG